MKLLLPAVLAGVAVLMTLAAIAVIARKIAKRREAREQSERDLRTIERLYAMPAYQPDNEQGA